MSAPNPPVEPGSDVVTYRRSVSLPVSLGRDPAALDTTITAACTDLEAVTVDVDGADHIVVPGSVRAERMFMAHHDAKPDGTGDRSNEWSPGMDIPTWATELIVMLAARLAPARPLADRPITFDVQERDS